MNENIKNTLNESFELLTDAKVLLSALRWNAAVSRSYYAMFHAARAVLLLLGIETFTHQGVNTQFAKHYIKTGVFDKSASKTFSKMLEIRLISDYEVGFRATQADAEHSYEEAERFVTQISEYIKSQTTKNG